MEITRHFTTSVYIVCQNKILLHMHKKLKMWLPVGGHIDRDELPSESALREVKEECGLKIKFIATEKKLKFTTDRCEELINPVHIILQNINPFHQHIDFSFFAKALTTNLNPEKGESTQFKWFNKEDLKKSKISENVKLISLEALKIIND